MDNSSPPPTHILPTFTPVPRLRDRSNGWKPEVQRAFIEALADTGSVASACRAVGRSTHGAYHLRRQPGAEEFAKAWQAALDLGMQRIEDVAMDRALNGVEQPVYSYGKLVGTRIVHNDRLLMFMLRNRAPERFAEGKPKGLNAVDKAELARLKAKWRKEWEREWGAEQMRKECATIESINRKIDLIREREEAAERLEEAHRQRNRLKPEDTRDPLTLPPPGWQKGQWEPPEEPEEENPRWRSAKDEGWE